MEQFRLKINFLSMQMLKRVVRVISFILPALCALIAVG